MTRHDKEDLSEFILPTNDTITYYYDENGKLITLNEKLPNNAIINKDGKILCAKQVISKHKTFSYILCAGGMFFNPRHKDSRYMSRKIWKFVKVTPVSYKLYLQYLQTNRQSLLHQAEREML